MLPKVDFLSWSSLILSYGDSVPIWELTVWHFSGQALKQNEMRLSKELWEKDYGTESHEVIILFKYVFYNFLGFILKHGLVGKFLG